MAESVDCFKEEFKRYKKRTTTDLSDVIDLRASEQFNGEVRYVHYMTIKGEPWTRPEIVNHLY